MIALPENAIEPAIASARPGHKAGRGDATSSRATRAVAIDSPCIARRSCLGSCAIGDERRDQEPAAWPSRRESLAAT